MTAVNPIEHLRSGRGIACEVLADKATNRRFAYVVHAVESYQRGPPESKERLFRVGTLELPSHFLEAEKRGEVWDQDEFEEASVDEIAAGAVAAVKRMYELIGARQIVQPIQDEYGFQPPVLM
ncbi:MAG: hypothetical protein AAFQ65_01490 [Myxococcota bacterium]